MYIRILDAILALMKKADKFFSNTITWCYHVLFFVTPLLFTWFNEELFEFNKMLFVYAMTLIIGGLWIAQMTMRRKFQWKRSIFDIPIGIFLGSQLLSTIFSIDLWTSIFGYYTRFNGGLLSTIAYITLLVVFIQKVPAQKVWKYFTTLAVGSVVVSAIAIPEHFGHSLSCILINSSHLSQTLPVSEVFSLPQLWQSYNTQCWVQDVQSRVFATFGQPNWLAAYAITLLPVFTILAAIRKSKEQWLYGLASVGLMLDLIFTKSRSGTLGLAIGAVWFAVLAVLWIRQRQLDSKKPLAQVVSCAAGPLRVAAVVGTAVILCAVLFGTPYSPSVTDLFQGSPKPVQIETPSANRLDEGGTSSAEIRKIVWSGAFKVWKRYPIFGSGVETFAYSYYTDRPMAHNTVSEWDFLYNKAHNEFLNYLATTGLFGLVSYCILLIAMVGYPGYMAIKNKNNSPELSALLLSVSAGLVALTISNALGFSTVMVCVLLYLLPAMCWQLQQSSPVAQQASKPNIPAQLLKRDMVNEEDEDALTLTQWLWLTVVGLVVIIGLVGVWRTWRADYLFAKGKSLNQSQQYSDGVEALESAYRIGGNEGIFAEELSETYSWLSTAFAEANQATPAAAYRKASIEKANESIATNPYNLNFYKSKTRILATLAAQDPSLLAQAEQTLMKASDLAPTDPKVRFNLGLIRFNTGKVHQAVADIEQAVSMKPNYEEARMTLARFYVAQEEPQKALEQYRYVLDKIQPANTLATAGIASIEAQMASTSAQSKSKR